MIMGCALLVCVSALTGCVTCVFLCACVAYAFVDWAGSHCYEQHGQVTALAFHDKERTLLRVFLFDDEEEIGIPLPHQVVGKFRAGNRVAVVCQRGWLSHHLCINGIDPT